MQEPFGVALRIEITSCFPEPEIRKEEERCNRCRTKVMIRCRFQQKVAGREQYKAHAKEARNDALGAIVIKVQILNLPLASLPMIMEVMR